MNSYNQNKSKHTSPTKAAASTAAKATPTKAAASTATKATPTKAASTPKARGKVRVTLQAVMYSSAVGTEEVFVVGNLRELGEWKVAKAKKMSPIDGIGFETIIEVDKGTVIEYKLVSSRNWSSVEKGVMYEELANHVVVASADCTDVVGVSVFKIE